jgi:hypothetical protein
VRPTTSDLNTLVERADGLPTEEILELSVQLFNTGRRDEGVFWYYVAQLRGRMEMATNRDAEVAYGAVFASTGPMFNEYAGADISKYTATMDRVLAWDDAHPMPGVSAELRDKTRAGLSSLRDNIRAHAEDMRTTRAGNGLPNSGH